MEDYEPARKQRREEDQVDRFMNWAQNDANISLSQKVAHSQDVAAHYGMVATADISSGETLFTIPTTSVISPQTCSISNILTENIEELASPSGWIPLIISLMYERLNPQSKWKPYLDAFPNFLHMELPMFWDEADLEVEFKGTGIIEAVTNDLTSMRKEHESIALPFIRKHKNIFKNPLYESFLYFQKQAAFIMAYSFTDNVTPPEDCSEADSDEEAEPKPFPTIMVPMADLLNHVPNHNAELKMGERTLRMVAVRDIEKGEEVFNTFGQLSNHTLMMMYGFTVPESDNPYNSVIINASDMKRAAQQTNTFNMALIFKLLTRKNIEDSDSIYLHKEGLDDDLNMLQIFSMRDADMESFLNTEEDSEWESDEETDGLTFQDISEQPTKVRELLTRLANSLLFDMPAELDTKLALKQTFAKHLRESRRVLLEKLLSTVQIRS